LYQFWEFKVPAAFLAAEDLRSPVTLSLFSGERFVPQSYAEPF